MKLSAVTSTSADAPQTLETRSALRLDSPMQAYATLNIGLRVNLRISHPPQKGREILNRNETP